MDYTEISSVVNDIAHRFENGAAPGYFDCLQALDTLEFQVLDRIDESDCRGEMKGIRDRAELIYSQLASIAQSAIDNLIHEVRTRQLAPLDLKRRFNVYAGSVSDNATGNQPDYDLFDDFLSQLFQVDYEPSETCKRTHEMVYLQPTPGRVILEMLNTLPFTKSDCFYDLGSGLGLVPILVSLLTDAIAVGIEIEPTYVHYSQCSARKLGISRVAFRSLDVRDSDLSDGTIFYMFTPFTGNILYRVLNNLREIARERKITVCTYGPCTPIIEQESWLYPIRRSDGKIYRLAIFGSAEV